MTLHDDESATDQRRGLSRRAMLQRTAAAGAVAWTAPVIMASPAAAQVPSPGEGLPVCLHERVFAFKYEVLEPGKSPSNEAWLVITDDGTLSGIPVGQFVALDDDDCVSQVTWPQGDLADDCMNRLFVRRLTVLRSDEFEVRVQFPADCDLVNAATVAKEGSANAGDGCDFTVDDPAALANHQLVFKKFDDDPTRKQLGVSNVQAAVKCCADDFIEECGAGVPAT